MKYGMRERDSTSGKKKGGFVDQSGEKSPYLTLDHGFVAWL
jgi:hypothetical protein